MLSGLDIFGQEASCVAGSKGEQYRGASISYLHIPNTNLFQERGVDPKDESDFKNFFHKRVNDDNVEPAFWFIQDEFNEF